MSNANTSKLKPVGEHVVAKLNGFVRKYFEAGEETNGWRRIFFGLPSNKPVGVPRNHIMAGYTREITIHNARLMQAKSTDTHSFFEKHGFVLLQAPTRVNNWNQDNAETDTDITKIYHGEVDALIREQLFPRGTNFHDIKQKKAVLRRGPNSQNNFYGSGVHQDYALTTGQFKDAVAAYITDEQKAQEARDQFDAKLAESDVVTMICFWRPINMEDKLINNPLCVLDCNTVKSDDIVLTELYGITPTSKPLPQLSVKYDEGQKWCYYPDMTCDEVLVFKQFFYRKGDPDAAYKCCFHSAFVDPREGYFSQQKRESTEHRVLVFMNEMEKKI